MAGKAEHSAIRRTQRKYYPRGKFPRPSNPEQKEPEKPQGPVRTPGLEKAGPKAEGQENGGKSQPSDPLYRAYLWATIIGVAGGFFGLYLIREQVIAAKSSADAAYTNALALMNAERAWITVSVRATEDLWKPGGIGGVVVLKDPGRTPAVVKTFNVKVQSLRSIQEIDGTPDQIEEREEVKGVIVAPGEPSEIPLSIAKWRSAPHTLAVRGIVRYFDVYGKSWFTRFLYFCDSMLPSGPIAFRTNCARLLQQLRGGL